VVLVPGWVVRVEVFERGLFVRPSYWGRRVFVDAFSGTAEVLASRDLRFISPAELEGRDVSCLNARLTVGVAAERARAAVLPEERTGWRRALRLLDVYVDREACLACGRAIRLRNGEGVDLFSGRHLEAADLLVGALLGEAGPGASS
jgi:hypothetical protein